MKTEKEITPKQKKTHETNDVAVDVEASTGCFNFRFFVARKHRTDFAEDKMLTSISPQKCQVQAEV